MSKQLKALMFATLVSLGGLAAPSTSLAGTATITATVDAVGAMSTSGGRIRLNSAINCPGGDDKALWLMQGSGPYGAMNADERQAAQRMIAIANAALLSGRTVTIQYETTALWGYCYGYYIRIN